MRRKDRSRRAALGDQEDNNPDDENNPGDLHGDGRLIGSVIQVGPVPVRGSALSMEAS
jgi:hypothetical protein